MKREPYGRCARCGKPIHDAGVVFLSLPPLQKEKFKASLTRLINRYTQYIIAEPEEVKQAA